MRRPVFWGLLALFLAGCSAEEKPHQGKAQQDKIQKHRGPTQSFGAENVVLYRCADAKTLSIDLARAAENPGSVRLAFEETEIRLTRVIAGSGEKYSNGTWTWWGKGNEGVLMQGDHFLAKDCLAQARL